MASTSQSNRPLSPHLSVYKMIPTMFASIMHRITGVGLYLGTFFVAWWLIAAASGEAYFDFVSAIYGSWFGLIILLGYTWALMHHLLGGLRHFFWDATLLMEKHTATKLAYGTFAGSIGLTVLIWLGILIAG